jgi:LmbE family N-acetylglucosaminyl deacetylase
VDVLRAHEPETVLTHFGDDMHPDHRTTSRLVTDAYYMASLPLVETDHPPHDPGNVYFFGKPTSSFDPERFVDVTATEETKEAAIRRHESQVEFLESHGGVDAEFRDLVEGVRAEARTLGRRVGCRFAEGFVPLHETATAYLAE